MTYIFASKFLSWDSIELNNISKNRKNYVFGEFNKNINFSTASAEKLTIYELLHNIFS